MPLYRKFSHGEACVWVWKYEENEFLEEAGYKEMGNDCQVVHPTKLAEKRMVRHILNEYLPGHKLLYVDNGEPYLEPKTVRISISHTFPYVAVASSQRPVGIDLEKAREKINRIEHKFILHETDFLPKDPQLRTQYLTAIWCVKEALYKMHHSKFWSLKKHYEVKPFKFEKEMVLQCRVYNEDFSDVYYARVFEWDNLLFAIVVE